MTPPNPPNPPNPHLPPNPLPTEAPSNPSHGKLSSHYPVPKGIRIGRYTINRTASLCILGAALLIFINLIAFQLYRSQRQAAMQAADELIVCRKLIADIQAMQQKPSLTAANPLQTSELTRRIEQAGQAAGFLTGPNGNLVRIWPEPARQVAQSPFQQRPTRIVLRQVSLKQVIQFMHRLTENDPTLRWQNIRLSAPRGEETGDRWSVEATLVYDVFVPPSSQTPKS